MKREQLGLPFDNTNVEQSTIRAEEQTHLQQGYTYTLELARWKPRYKQNSSFEAAPLDT